MNCLRHTIFLQRYVKVLPDYAGVHCRFHHFDAAVFPAFYMVLDFPNLSAGEILKSALRS